MVRWFFAAPLPRCTGQALLLQALLLPALKPPVMLDLYESNMSHRFLGGGGNRWAPNQWLFLVPLKGGRWHIIPQLAVYI